MKYDKNCVESENACHAHFLHFIFFFLMIRRPPRSTLFPTRRSSDLESRRIVGKVTASGTLQAVVTVQVGSQVSDRKSTRLNSSHLVISYAVFCLKKKKIMNDY